MNFDDLPDHAAPAEPVKFEDLPDHRQAVTAPPPAAIGPMPGPLESLSQGWQRGWAATEAAPGAFRGEAPALPPETSPAAQPLEWQDVLHPSRLLSKTAYGLGESGTTIGAGVAGGLLGAGVAGPAGGVAGGALGAAAGAAVQKLAPSLQEELAKNPSDPNGAYDRALHSAEISGVFSGIGWGLFGGVGGRFFQGPVRQLALQAMGVQPAVGAAEQVTQNIAAGDPLTQGVGQAAAQSAVGTAVPMAGHALVHAALPARGQAALPAAPPRLDPNAPERPVDVTQPVPGEAPTPPRDMGMIRGAVYRAIDKYKRTFQPEEISDLSRQAAGPFRETMSTKASRIDPIIHSDQEAWRLFQGMPRNEKIQFMVDMEQPEIRDAFYQMRNMAPDQAALFIDNFNKQGGPQIDPKLAPHAAYMDFALDHMARLDKDVGAKYSNLMNYFPRQYKDPESVQQFVQNRINSMGMNKFQKHRTYEFLLDALNAGHELVSDNPVDLFNNRMSGSINLQENMNLLRRLNQMGTATPLRTPEEIEHATTSGWRVIGDPIGDKWALHPDLSPMWDNTIAAGGLWQDPSMAGSMFRNWMGLKNVWAPIKLMASLFHPLHVAHINLAQGFARGWEQLKAGDLAGALASPVKGLTGIFYHPGAINARDAWLTPEWKRTPEQQAVVNTMAEGGFSPQLSEELKIAGARQFQEALANQEWHKTLKPAIQTAIQKMQAPIFEKWIPSLKTAAYLDQARALLERHPELNNDDVSRRAALGTIAKSIDNRYGEMFYKNLFWNKTLKDMGIGSFLSLGWNLGFLREFGGGALEPFLKNAIDQTPTRAAINMAKNKTAFAMIYMANAMAINALISKFIGGVNFGDEQMMDYFLPQIGGTNPDGSPRRISNMFYTREIPMLEKHIEEKQSVIRGVAGMLWNKMMFQPITELWNNRNYYGFNIYDETAPEWKQLYQMGSYILGDQFNPIGVSSGKRALTNAGKWDDNDPLKTKIWKLISEPESQAAIAGFAPAPSYASKTATVNRLYALFGRYVSPVERPQAEQQTVEDRRNARNAYQQAVRRGDQPAIAEAAGKLAALGIGSKELKKAQPGTADIYMFSRLPYSVQGQFLKEIPPEDFKRYYPKANKKVRGDPEIQQLIQQYYRSPGG